MSSVTCTFAIISLWVSKYHYMFQLILVIRNNCLLQQFGLWVVLNTQVRLLDHIYLSSPIYKCLRKTQYLCCNVLIICLKYAHPGSQIAACFARPSNDERIIWAEIMKLKAEQKTVSMKDEFAAYSKLQRRINKLEVQLKDNSQTRISKKLAVKSSIQLFLQGFVAFVMVISVIWFRREPIVALKGDLFPLSNMLRYPSDVPNAISTHVWVVISNISIRTLLKPITS